MNSSKYFLKSFSLALLIILAGTFTLLKESKAQTGDILIGADFGNGGKHSAIGEAELFFTSVPDGQSTQQAVFKVVKNTSESLSLEYDDDYCLYDNSKDPNKPSMSIQIGNTCLKSSGSSDVIVMAKDACGKGKDISMKMSRGDAASTSHQSGLLLSLEPLGRDFMIDGTVEIHFKDAKSEVCSLEFIKNSQGYESSFSAELVIN
ncbi:MAG: hypothetical protein KDK66_07570 [Deltaproteobacteria bacterium]|nr:hypothetical protein [Deltaproteobacteria bacterium]